MLLVLSRLIILIESVRWLFCLKFSIRLVNLSLGIKMSVCLIYIVVTSVVSVGLKLGLKLLKK